MLSKYATLICWTIVIEAYQLLRYRGICMILGKIIRTYIILEAAMIQMLQQGQNLLPSYKTVSFQHGLATVNSAREFVKVTASPKANRR